MIDIDALLAKDSLELKMNGKIFTITDIDLPLFLAALSKKDNKKLGAQNLYEQFAQVAKVSEDELKGIGIRALMFALDEIQKWMTPKELENKRGESESPP